MTDRLDSITLARLMNWMSPAFPTGAFAYSSGLEAAVHAGLVSDRSGLQDWLEDLLAFGTAWNDAVLFAESWRRAAAGDDLSPVGELAEALAAASGRHLETMKQGAAFLEAAAAWPHPAGAGLGDACALPVASGALCGAHGIPIDAALVATLHATISNLVQAGLRLLQIGQQDAVTLMARLEPRILDAAKRAARSDLDDLGTPAMLADIMAMQHETLYSRLFRS